VTWALRKSASGLFQRRWTLQPRHVKQLLSHIGPTGRLALVGLITVAVLALLLAPASPLALNEHAAIEDAASLRSGDVERASVAYWRVAAPIKIVSVLAVLITAGLAALTIIRERRPPR
jgi:hypothetical protein